MGLKQSSSLGIVSALHRHEIRPRKAHRYSDFIQTDAAINKGSSGGPLFNEKGQVIGMNTAIKKKGRGLAFSIPSNLIAQLIPHLKKGEVVRSWLGVSVGPTDPPEMPREGIQLKISRVFKESPAEKAGLKNGDLIERLDGMPIVSTDTFAWTTGMKGAGNSIRLEVLREDSPTPAVIVVQLEAKPKASQATTQPIVLYEADDVTKYWGIAFAEVDGELQIKEVRAGSNAEKLGLRQGDIVVRLGQGEQQNQDGVLRAALRAVKSRILELEVLREKRRYYIPIKAEQLPNP